MYLKIGFLNTYFMFSICIQKTLMNWTIFHLFPKIFCKNINITNFLELSCTLMCIIHSILIIYLLRSIVWRIFLMLDKFKRKYIT